jgi:cytidine deaminase
VTDAELIAAATDARTRAFAPFSKFPVGAALEATDGTIVTGCNVESASYGLTMCAERVAVFKGVSEGMSCFKRVAVVTDTEHPTPPCGACRQVLWEFASDADVILANLAGKVLRFTMKELIPHAFDAKQLG